jgi:formylglycine-generating enzyme
VTAKLFILSGLFSCVALAQSSITIPTSYVGNPGNAADGTGYGAVSYGYHIGTYEVTNSQWVSFLNNKAATDSNGLCNSSISITRSGSSGSYSYSVDTPSVNKPVTYVSFWDAKRFTHWITNRQGNGDTENLANTSSSNLDYD